MIDDTTLKKLYASMLVFIIVILALQAPVIFIASGKASGSAPLDDSQPPPKVNPVPFAVNDTGPLAEAAEGPETTIVIGVEFSNLNHTTSITDIDKVVFQDMNRYYQETSFGALSVVGRTVGWYRLNYSLSYYGRDGLVVDDPNFDGGIESWWLIRDAVKAADKDVDFAAYENVVVVHAGNGQESSKIPDDVWSVSYSGLWIKTADERSVHNGMVVPESEARGAVTLGVYAHEFGHQLGLPDLYEYGSSKSFVEHWGLMDRGLWNGNPKGSSPAHPMAYSKIKLGWIPSSRVMIVNASMNVNVTLHPTELRTDGYQAIKIPIKGVEYYLVEVRRKIGFDIYLPSEGVLISYVNERLGSGYGRVKLMDSHTLTTTLDDAAWDVGRVFADPNGKFSVRILSSDGESYLVNVDRSGPAPDIAIKDIRIEPSAARTNETVTIYADIVNQGTLSATNFYVNCYIDEIFYSKTRMSLSAGRSTTIKVEWKATGGSHDIRFSTDSGSLVSDMNRNNDVLSRKIAVGLLLKISLPEDAQATINGTVYQADANSEINIGVLPGTQQIEVTSVQSLGNGTRRVFVRWSDGNISNPRTVTLESDTSLAAEYKKQYYVTVNANSGLVSGEGWYDEGSAANIEANTSSSEVDQKSRSIFTHWSGDSTSSANTLTITVNQPYSFTANWRKQYYLSVNSDHGSTTGSGWYDENVPATFSIEPTSEIGENVRKYFLGWTGDAASSQASMTIAMDSPKTVSATWKVEYHLTVVSPYGDPTGQDWYDSGAVANVSVKSIVDHDNGTRHVFMGWTNDASTDSSAISVTMDSPKTVMAEWKTQYRVSFTASGLPDGTQMNVTINSLVVKETVPFAFSDWYDCHTVLNLNATDKISKGYQTYVFSRWVNSTGVKVADTITVNGPQTLTAVYTQSFGCIIATATFESELSPEVQLLRNLRDQQIMRTFAGRQFMTAFNAWYYSFSPTIAAAIADNHLLRTISKLILYPLIGILHVSGLTYNFLGNNPELAVVVAGFAASFLIGAVYLAPVALAFNVLVRRRLRSIRLIKLVLGILAATMLVMGVSESLELSQTMMFSSVTFVLATMSLSTILCARSISFICRKLNSSRTTSLQSVSR